MRRDPHTRLDVARVAVADGPDPGGALVRFEPQRLGGFDELATALVGDHRLVFRSRCRSPATSASTRARRARTSASSTAVFESCALSVFTSFASESIALFVPAIAVSMPLIARNTSHATPDPM